MDRRTIKSYHDGMRTMVTPMGGKAVEVVNMLDTVCLQPKV